MVRIASESEPFLRIDCDECALQATASCEDCVVTFLCGTDAARTATPVVVDLAEARAMRVMGEAGLAPPLRHTRSTG